MYASNIHNLDETIPGFDVTAGEVVKALVEANEELNLPHSVHIHCNNLGIPGNCETTLETMKLVSNFSNDRRQVLHVTHVQFNAYTGSSWKDIGSGAEEIAKYVNSAGNITIDMGQIVFGHATTMTADSPFQFALHRLVHMKWCNKDVELETGTGIVPIVYRAKSPVNAVQWAIGLELGLLVEPDKVAISTDYPNAGQFTSYPYIMALLMIMTLALLVYALAERQLRLRLLEEDESIPNQLGKATQSPTLRWVFQLFEGIDLLIIRQNGKTIDRRVLNLHPVHITIIQLLGPHVRNCYLFPT
jgi:formylmethanofuran dehydrogenase subunit A